jgi:uncharacterized membrane protein
MTEVVPSQEELSVMNSSFVFVLAFAIGLITGLRSMTGPALVCWAAHLGWLSLGDSRLAFMESTLATYVFSAFALGELVADKLPFIPNRTSPGPLFGRIVLGALCGAAMCISADYSPAVGAILGGTGGLAGAFAGYQARRALVKRSRLPDWVVAVLEDVVAVGGGLLVVSRLVS